MKEVIIVKLTIELTMLVVFILLINIGWSVIEWMNWFFVIIGALFIIYKIIQRQ
jgi:hypothetical protein